LAVLIRALAAQGSRVLVCAPSNKAVCVAVEQYVRAGGTTCALVGVEDTLMECSTNVLPAGTSASVGMSAFSTADATATAPTGWDDADDDNATGNHGGAATYFVQRYVRRLEQELMARCAFFDRDLHSRMQLVSTPACLKRCHACDQ
jgi:hypothetical protein